MKISSHIGFFLHFWIQMWVGTFNRTPRGSRVAHMITYDHVLKEHTGKPERVYAIPIPQPGIGPRDRGQLGPAADRCKEHPGLVTSFRNRERGMYVNGEC